MEFEDHRRGAGSRRRHETGCVHGRDGGHARGPGDGRFAAPGSRSGPVPRPQAGQCRLAQPIPQSRGGSRSRRETEEAGPLAGLPSSHTRRREPGSSCVNHRCLGFRRSPYPTGQSSRPYPQAGMATITSATFGTTGSKLGPRVVRPAASSRSRGLWQSLDTEQGGG